MKAVTVFALLAVASTGAMAQATPPSDDSPTEDGPPRRWGLGVGAIAQNSPYVGEGMRVQPIPLISYEGEHFFFAASPRAGSSATKHSNWRRSSRRGSMASTSTN